MMGSKAMVLKILPLKELGVIVRECAIYRPLASLQLSYALRLLFFFFFSFFIETASSTNNSSPIVAADLGTT